jgi:crotonobetaine/carnitine-CoA ligase
LIQHCSEQLAYFAVPRYLEFVDELPITSNGKIEK